jgi:hypothetical protein
MKKVKIFVFVLLLGVLIITTDALALVPGDPFWFYDVELPGNVELPGKTKSWTHDFYDPENNDLFLPSLSGLEPNLIIDHALLILSLNFTPIEYMNKYVFKASVELEGNLLGNINYSSWCEPSVYDWHWWKSITGPVVLNENGILNMQINVTKGTLNYVHNSFITGSAHVGPEPISMALLGAGLAGLPIAVRFRRLLRK